MGKAALEQAYGDDKVDLAVGTTGSAVALAMLPIAEEYKKVLIVEPAVADQITGDKWNRYIFRTARSSMQDALAAAATLKDENINIATLAQDYAFGKDGVASLKEALAAVGDLLDQVGDRPLPAEELRTASARLREHIARPGWPGELLIECSGLQAADLPADDAELWHRIDARSDLCTGQKCPEFARCFLTAMKQRAQEADLIIVNHHLFFADLAIRQDDFGSILPEYSAVVFDEAHEIEDVASDYRCNPAARDRCRPR